MIGWSGQCLWAGHVAVSVSIKAEAGVLTGTCARCGKDIRHARGRWQAQSQLIRHTA